MKIKYFFQTFGFLVIAGASIAPEISAREVLDRDREIRGSIDSKSLAQFPDSGRLVEVTGVKLNPTENGLEILLETSSGGLQPLIFPENNNLVIEIPDAVLLLSDGGEFTSIEPGNEIAEVKIVQSDPRTIRVSIVGKNGVPNARVLPSEKNIVLSVTSSETPKAEEEIEVIATREGQEDNYLVPSAPDLTKLKIPIFDYPGSVQVIPEQVIRDRQVVRLSELADNIPGVQAQSGYGGMSSLQTYIRGFSADENFRNGFRDFSFTSPRDVANIERVEVLKGPASILFGNVQPGGIINTVTKQPLADPFYSGSMTFGSFNFYRPTLDFSGPLTSDRSVLYRLNMAYEDADSFRDFGFNQSLFLAPALTFNIGERTKLTMEFNYQNYDYFFDRGFAPADVFLDLPIERVVLGEPGFNRSRWNSFFYTYNFEHQFNDNWKVRQGLGVLQSDGFTRQLQPRSFESPFIEPDGTLRRRAQETDETQDNFSLQTEVTGKFNTGSIRHNILFGTELSTYNFAYTFYRAPAESINIFDPVYGTTIPELEFSFAEKYGSTNIGLYVQDFIEILPNLKILLGVRLDWADVYYKERITNEVFNEFSAFAASPRAGILYQPIESTSLYFSWSRSFNPQTFGISQTGEAFDPETGEQFEIGIKQEIIPDRLVATLALYNITKNNVLTPDPSDPTFSIATGEQTSNGIEFDVTGEILPGWNIILTYAYTNAYVSEDNSIPTGDKLVGVPLNSASLWTTYEIQKGTFQGLGFGLGIYYVDSREGNLPNDSFQLPSYVRADAGIFYRQKNYRVALNFKNLFNTRYYQTQGFWVTPQAPFSVLGSFSINF